MVKRTEAQAELVTNRSSYANTPGENLIAITDLDPLICSTMSADI